MAHHGNTPGNLISRAPTVSTSVLPCVSVLLIHTGVPAGASTFFHIMQMSVYTGPPKLFFVINNSCPLSFSATDGAPVYFLDILKNGVSFKDATTESVLATASLASILATPLQHTLTVTYGPTGSLNYVITNSQTGASIFKYSMKGHVGSGGN